ncbi:MAG: hypothetical protein QOE17_2595 [Gaiellales bacterium]|nr:hypothetical protein [Gaiellales bacterium]
MTLPKREEEGVRAKRQDQTAVRRTGHMVSSITLCVDEIQY